MKLLIRIFQAVIIFQTIQKVQLKCNTVMEFAVPFLKLSVVIVILYFVQIIIFHYLNVIENKGVLDEVKCQNFFRSGKEHE